MYTYVIAVYTCEKVIQNRSRIEQNFLKSQFSYLVGLKKVLKDVYFLNVNRIVCSRNSGFTAAR